MQKLFPHELRNMFKVELHRHLDCSVRWSTLVELAPSLGIELPSDSKARREMFLISEPMKDLETVLKKFLRAQKVLASEEILTRVAFEACEDAYNDGIRLLELRYAPTFILDGHSNLTAEKIHLAFLKGLQMARSKFELSVGLICILQRIKSPEIASEITSFAIEHKDSFIGIDLADNEDACEPRTFEKVFNRAKLAGLHITVHSGESPGTAKWVEDSVEILGAERIGHGIQIINEPSVLNFIKDKKIPLEVCPISNWLTQAAVTHMSHPIRKLQEHGVLVTINSDDPGIFGTTLSDDYQVLADVHSFTESDFKKCNQTAFDHSFLKDKQRFKHLFYA